MSGLLSWGRCTPQLESKNILFSANPIIHFQPALTQSLPGPLEFLGNGQLPGECPSDTLGFVFPSLGWKERLQFPQKIFWKAVRIDCNYGEFIVFSAPLFDSLLWAFISWISIIWQHQPNPIWRAEPLSTVADVTGQEGKRNPFLQWHPETIIQAGNLTQSQITLFTQTTRQQMLYPVCWCWFVVTLFVDDMGTRLVIYLITFNLFSYPDKNGRQLIPACHVTAGQIDCSWQTKMALGPPGKCPTGCSALLSSPLPMLSSPALSCHHTPVIRLVPHPPTSPLPWLRISWLLPVRVSHAMLPRGCD